MVNMQNNMRKNILNIYCPSCGAPAQFDIVRQIYCCQYCEGKVTIEDAKKVKDQITRVSNKKVEKDFGLETTSCSGCGATVVFEENEALARLKDEAETNYRTRMEQLWGTRSIDMETKVEAIVDLPVLLPVYYIADGDVKAAVNGQTGKISVRAEKNSSYLEIPWWIKGIGLLLLALGLTFMVVWFSGYPLSESLGITGILGGFYFLVFICMFQDGGSTAFEPRGRGWRFIF